MTEPNQHMLEQQAIMEEQARIGQLLAEMVLDRAFKLVNNEMIRLARKLLRRSG